jgi:hypothetical protein
LKFEHWTLKGERWTLNVRSPEFTNQREQPPRKTLKAFQIKAWGQPRSGATPRTSPVIHLACGPSSLWSAAANLDDSSRIFIAADQGLDGRKGEEVRRQANLGWRSRLGRSLTPGFDLKRFQRLSWWSWRFLIGFLIAVSTCGCGGDDAEPSPDSANPETVERVTPPNKTGTSQPGQTGLANTQKQLDPPVAPSPGETSSEAALVDPVPPKPTRKIFRPSYERTEHDPQRLADFGLSRFNTKHLQLITDLPGEQAEPLVPLVDALQPFLEDYFGKLPPARDGSDYRITGFVMADRNRFVQARLAKADLLDSFHGRQIGAEFWMNNQTLDYYRRHLLLHETVHCYMRHLEAGFPMWYLEGMAEMIATHRRTVDDPEPVPGEAVTSDLVEPFTFNVMPAVRMRFRGLERIIILQRDVKKNGVRSIAQIRAMTGNDFKNGVEPYAWCWALCRFLDSHPATKEQFRKLAKSFLTTSPDEAIQSFFAAVHGNLATEWALFATSIDHAYDFESHAIVFQNGRPLEADLHVVEVDCRKSWQTTLLKVEAGTTYEVAAGGQFTLSQGERPWVSEANGISIRYHKGQPLGRLLGAVHVEGKPPSMLQSLPLGNNARFTASQTGTLYLRVNDWPHSLSDNQGTLSVSIRKK